MAKREDESVDSWEIKVECAEIDLDNSDAVEMLNESNMPCSQVQDYEAMSEVMKELRKDVLTNSARRLGAPRAEDTPYVVSGMKGKQDPSTNLKLQRFTSLYEGTARRATSETRAYSVPRKRHAKPGTTNSESPQRHLEGAGEMEMLTTPQGRREWTQKQVYGRRREYLQPVSVKIFAGTWNVCGNRPACDLSDWLFCDDEEYDVYAIGLQEVQPLSGMSAMATDPSRGRCWTAHVEKALRSQGDYVCICARQMVGILLLVFVRREHELHIKEVMVTEAGTGFMYKGGNKGAVAMRFQLFESTFCFVSCHLAAQQNNVIRRNQDYREVMRKVAFSPETEYSITSLLYATPENVRTISDHDLVIWVGDLNYRIDMDSGSVLDAIQEEDWGTLLAKDQLNNTREKESYLFEGFQEGELNFAPTYKTNKNEDGYVLGEDGLPSRPPAWTDRILWKTRNIVTEDGKANEPCFQAKCMRYRRHEILSSDHRPVSSSFDVSAMKLNGEIRAKVLNDVHSTLLPDVLFHPEHVVMVQVRLGCVSEAFVVLRNNGRVPIEYEVCKEELPKWLEVTPQRNRVFAGEVDEICLSVRADEDSCFYRNGFHVPSGLDAEKIPLTTLLQVVVKYGPTLDIRVDSSFLSSTLLGSSLESLLKDYPSNVEYVPKPIADLCTALASLEPGPFEFCASEELMTEAYMNISRLQEVGSKISREALGQCLLEVIEWLEEKLISRDLYEQFKSLGAQPAEQPLKELFDSLPQIQQSVLGLVLTTFKKCYVDNLKDAYDALAVVAFATDEMEQITGADEDASVHSDVINCLDQLANILESRSPGPG
mmetsp:Transcript_5667/g.16850  ORF Transcript_5667/g.16850 Transcript_5667/m.16850 type:complete len:825 (-) Transcript_5667:186-2660(-)|eukprot:CAMPEP_0198730070 /NCGR_PEP_ID=MMETSP1475-20131203/22706_1 /TAXON_ID= ORGANISM="Unidentified sp., Strain CCMP1999" /NCGR_SAMPLE_ID=MMETSP1475 /ASSEMBLY_ACC=CAM_ASM_001111 /LENGTH=824 /DNA_ID=CAMNT_0044492833 /DNA_START=552 /DNA_END=3026 /DNA_ORIENTATION=+